MATSQALSGGAGVGPSGSGSRASSPAPQAETGKRASAGATAETSDSASVAAKAPPSGEDQPAEGGPTLPEIHLAAQAGNAERIHQLIHEQGVDANTRDSQNITPLHWAAINNRLLACKELLLSGAQVDAIGGELQASPLQWAARNGHVDVCHLLIYHGADAALKDLQGFNTLHLAVHSSNAILVLYILSQQLPLSLDEPDAAGRSALAWAAYQGDGISVDLLLRFGADPNKPDPGGLTPLHWAVVKGNANCIARIVKRGSDLTKRNNDGITPMELSKQLNSIHAFQRAMKNLGRFPDGRLKSPSLSLKHTKWATFLLPTAMIYLAVKTLDLLPWYTASLLVAGETIGGHHIVNRVLADGHPELDGMMSPYLVGIVAGSLFWVAYSWLTTIAGATSASLPGTNFVFVFAFVLCSYNLLRAVTLDPGFVPLYASNNQLKDVIEDVVSAGRFTAQEFCVSCMVRKPIRSKHCKICQRCVGKHDHHCPWIYNCVGVDNHRQFLLFVLNLVIGVIAFDRLVINYYSELPALPESERELTCLFPRPLCESSHMDTFTFATACWATLQLTWTSFVMASHSWQVSRQLTTLELSNLGRYGYMGGRPASNPASQQQQAQNASPCGHDHGGGGGHHHHNRAGNAFKRLLSLLGLDLYTKGKAAEGIKTSASERGQKLNPFDVGVWRNCTDFWSRGKTLGVDYLSLYDVPEGGFKAQLSSRRQEGLRDKKTLRRGGGRYEMVNQVDDV